MSETTAPPTEKAAKIRRKPEHESVLSPTFAAARLSSNNGLLQRHSSGQGLLQRQCSCGKHTLAGGICEECQKKGESSSRASPDEMGEISSAVIQPFSDQPRSFDLSAVPARTLGPSSKQIIQPYLIVNELGDQDETEADRVTGTVMHLPDSSQPSPLNHIDNFLNPTLRPPPALSQVQIGAGNGTFQAPPHVEARVNQRKDEGQPVDPETEQTVTEPEQRDFGDAPPPTNNGNESPNTNLTSQLSVQPQMYIQRSAPAQAYGATSPAQVTTNKGQVVQRGLWDDIVGGLQNAGEWATRIATIAANPIPALMSGLWLQLPNRFKPRLINTLLDAAGAILDRMRGLVSVAMGFLWPLIRSIMLGFIRHMRGVGDNLKISMSNRLARLLTGGSITFILHFAKGIALAAWDVIRTPYDLIVGVIDGLRFVAQVLSNLSSQSLVNAFNLIQSGFSAAWEGLAQMVRNPSQAVQFLRTLWSSIQRALGNLGSQIAGGIVEFFQLPDAQMGEQTGRFAGSIIVDAVLSVVLPAVGGALRRALASVQQFMRLFRAGQRGGRVMRMIRPMIQPVKQGLQRMGDIFRQGRFGNWLRSFRQFLDDLMNAADEAMSSVRRQLPGGRSADVDLPNRPRPHADVDADVPHRPRTGPDADVDTPTRPHNHPDADTDSPNRRDHDDDDSNRRRDDDEESSAEDRRRLERAVTAIRPALMRMLRDGVSRIRLTVQLQYWKLRHRLRRLYVDHTGGNRVDIIAQVNPHASVVRDVIDMQGSELMRAIRRVARRVEQHPDVQARLVQIRRQRQARAGSFHSDRDPAAPGTDLYGFLAGSNRRPANMQYLEAGGSTGHIAEGVHLRNLGRGTRTAEGINIGTSGHPHRVFETQGPSRLPGSTEVFGPGTYENMIASLEEISRRTGRSEQYLAQQMLQLYRTGALDPVFVEELGRVRMAALFPQIARVHFTVEPARSLGARVSSVHLMDMVAQGQDDLSLREALTVHNAPSLSGAAHPLHQLDEELGFEREGRYGSGTSTQNVRERELNFIERYVYLRTRHLMALDRASFEAELEDYIRDAFESDLFARTLDLSGLSHIPHNP